jgi:hypothetical protein
MAGANCRLVCGTSEGRSSRGHNHYEPVIISTRPSGVFSGADACSLGPRGCGAWALDSHVSCSGSNIPQAERRLSQTRRHLVDQDYASGQKYYQAPKTNGGTWWCPYWKSFFPTSYQHSKGKRGCTCCRSDYSANIITDALVPYSILGKRSSACLSRQRLAQDRKCATFTGYL